jgi:uncharacterized protein YicC (UPF0701 family)
MTGFGSAEASVGSHRIAVEIRSVNHRFFSPSIKVPSALARFEAEIREALRERIARGHVTASVRLGSDVESGPRLDGARIAAYAEQVAQIGRSLGIAEPIHLDTLLRLPQVVTTEEVTEVPLTADAVLPVVRQAAEQMDEMRAVEGAKLKAIILDRLRKAVTSLMEGALPDESRIAQEIAMLADRLDVAEEIARFATHISAFRATLDTPPADGVGKRLGFLLQELLREANTTGSKANDAAITADVLAIKEDLERIREQVENLE